MPRPISFPPDLIAERALQQFWAYGFHASSMDDLVKVTGISRHSIYSTFGGKRSLFLACLDCYKRSVVSPAFGVVEMPGADLSSVGAYFETQIALGEAEGLPGPGCLIANSATEVAPYDAEVMLQVTSHNTRLKRGFSAALQNSMPYLDTGKTDEMAQISVIFTNGLWTMSRSISNADTLRCTAKSFLSLLSERAE